MAYADSTTLPQSFRYNNVESVDTVFLKVLINNLFKDNTFKAGETFNDELQERGGQLYARRLGKQAATVKNALSAGGLDLTATETADSLILIQKKDAISRCEKCYAMVEQLRATGKSVDKVAEVVEEFKEGCQILWMSYLLADPMTEGSTLVGGATRSSSTTASTTFDGLIADITADRKQIRINGGNADVLIISPDAEAFFLNSAVKFGNAFTPETNESIRRDGKIGRLFGMSVYTSNLIGGGTPSTIPVAGNAPANSGNAANCEYIIYDHKAFAIAMDIEGVELVKAQDGKFMGSYAQVQGICGGGVTNPALAIAKIVTPSNS